MRRECLQRLQTRNKREIDGYADLIHARKIYLTLIYSSVKVSASYY